MKSWDDIDRYELFEYITGGAKMIDSGCYRDVYEYAPDPTKVLKYDNKYDATLANYMEAQVWGAFEYLRPWLAPVHWITRNGTWMLQSRTRPLTLEEAPTKIPRIFIDIKLPNWGVLDGVPVCHDYAHLNTHVLLQDGVRALDLVDVTKEQWVNRHSW